MSAVDTLPFPGNDPADLLTVANHIQRARGRLAQLTDGLVDARGDLTRSWIGGSADIGNAEVARAVTATALGVSRLDIARGAVLTCSEELAEIRTTIEGFRLEWEWNESRIQVAADQHRPDDVARYEGRQEMLLLDWRQQVATADAATRSCASKLQAAIQGERFSFGGGAASAGLGNALGTDLLGRDDTVLGRLRGGDAATWNQLSETDRAFLLAIAQATSFPPIEIDPQSVNGSWIQLDPMAQQALIFTQPAVIGALDGVPVVARDQANRLMVPTLAAQIRSELDLMSSRSVPQAHSAGYSDLGPEQQAAWDNRRADLLAQLGGLDSIADRLDDTDPAPVYLMGVNLQGRGQAIVSIGNPDTAANVATYLPGTGADLAGINSEVARSAALFRSAQSAGSASTAVVTWLGSATPAGLIAAASHNAAAAGGPLLNRYADALRATREGGPSHNSVIAHSYSTLTVAAAAVDGNTLAMDDVVSVAGTGMAVSSAKYLHLDGVPAEQVGKHVFATLADSDPMIETSPTEGLPLIRPFAVLRGDLPSADSFGATWFDSGVPDSVATAHGAYWNEGTRSLQTMGQIIATGSITPPK